MSASAPRWRALLLVSLFACALAVAFHPESLGVGGTWALPGWDATRVFWADLAFLRRSVLIGELPLWNPYDRGGYAFAAEPQSGVFDPITWLVVGVSLMLGDCPAWLISLKALMYYVLGATGVYAFVRDRAEQRGLEVPGWAMALGVMVYVVGGRMDKLKDQSGLWPSGWAPWLLLALAWALRRPDVRRGVVLGGVGGLALLSGYPPIPVRLCLLLLVPMGILWVTQALREAEDAAARRSYLGQLGLMVGVAAAVFFGLVAAQLVATLQVLPMTKRSDLGLAQVLASQVQPGHALGLFAPGESKVSVLLYAGVGCGAATLLAVVPSRGRIDPERALLLALGISCFLLACGENAPILPLLAELPGFRSFRIAGHFIVVTAVAGAVLVPLGAANLREGSAAHRVAAVVVGGIGWMIFVRYAHQPSGLAVAAAGLGVAGLCAVAWLSAPHVGLAEVRRRQAVAAAGWLAVLGVGVDVYQGNRPVASILQPPPDEQRSVLLAAAVEAPEHHRMADFSWAENRPGTRTGVRDLVGARPALTDRRYMAVYHQAQRSVGVLRAMGVSDAAFGRRAVVRSRLGRDRDAEGLAAAIRPVPDPWPRAFFVSSVVAVSDEQAAIEALSEVGARGPPRAIAFGTDAAALDDLAAATQGGQARPLALEIEGTTTLSVDLGDGAPKAGLVVLNEAWDPGWRAAVDGQPAPIHRVNLLHRAVRVPAAARSVTFEYRPPGLRWLWLLWLLTTVGFAATAVVTLRAAPSSD